MLEKRFRYWQFATSCEDHEVRRRWAAQLRGPRSCARAQLAALRPRPRPRPPLQVHAPAAVWGKRARLHGGGVHTAAFAWGKRRVRAGALVHAVRPVLGAPRARLAVAPPARTGRLCKTQRRGARSHRGPRAALRPRSAQGAAPGGLRCALSRARRVALCGSWLFNSKTYKKRHKTRKKAKTNRKQIEKLRKKSKKSEQKIEQQTTFRPQRRADRKKLALRWGISDK